MADNSQAYSSVSISDDSSTEDGDQWQQTHSRFQGIITAGELEVYSKHPDTMDVSSADVCSVTKHIPELLLLLEGFHVLLAF
jgi:hypothetical protein